MAKLMEGRKGVIFGVANKRSIAWSIAKALASEGAEIALTYQNERLESNVKKLSPEISSNLVMPCDAGQPAQVDEVFNKLEGAWGKLDFLVHSIAFANAADLEGDYIKTSQEGFDLALRISAYTLTTLSHKARPLLDKSDGGSIITMTYLGAEKAMPSYNIMGVAKAALESSVRYLARDLGSSGIRVNAISAGPINTLAARGIKGFSELLKHASDRAPLKRNVTADEVGNAALFLSSRLSSGITGEVMHVDAGYNIIGY
jgi:enoyl-[acyl-carrier protein] reductase I